MSTSLIGTAPQQIILTYPSENTFTWTCNFPEPDYGWCIEYTNNPTGVWTYWDSIEPGTHIYQSQPGGKDVRVSVANIDGYATDLHSNVIEISM
jgi:hypothetical protein